MKRKLYYTAHRDPSNGNRMLYLVGSVGYSSLKDIRRVWPDRTLVRLKAARINRIFGSAASSDKSSSKKALISDSIARGAPEHATASQILSAWSKL